MKTCDICRSPVMKWQSYEANGNTVQHISCALGHAPADHPTAHYSHSNTVFNKGDLRRERPRKIVSDEGMVFDE